MRENFISLVTATRKLTNKELYLVLRALLVVKKERGL